MVKFKDLATSGKKFSDNASAASPTYVKNASASGQTWQDNTVAGADNFAKGVSAAVANGTFAKGVAKAGSAKYVKQIAAVAGSRYTDGVTKGAPAWQAGFGPIAAAVSSVDIGPRGPRGSQANKQRSSAMQDAFMAAKKAQLG